MSEHRHQMNVSIIRYEYIQVCRSQIHESTISLRFLAIILRPPIPTVWLFSLPHWQFVSELPTAVRHGAVSLKGSHRMGDRLDFSENLFCASLINKGLSNETNFGQIHLAGQYL
jgi:hypothetical protein